jgi:sulfite exporter TauE/SafE/copper chaperone CopZ
MSKELIKVSGMHCKSCELLIENKIREIPGVKRVKASNSRAEVRVEGDFDQNAVNKAILESGYKLGAEEVGLVTAKADVYRDLVISLVVIAAVYGIFTIFGLSKVLPSVSSSSYSFGVVVLLGMTAGFSTCMALVGGLVLGFTARFREKHPEKSGFGAFLPNIYFNLGRIAGFFVLGGLLGAIGSVFKVTPLASGLMLLVVAAVMLLVGLQLTEISPAISKINLTLPKFLSKLIPGGKGYSHFGVISAGVLSFFLPCGFTQAVQLVAIGSGNFLTGAILMSLFAVGTTPGLLLVGSVASFAKGQFASRLFRFMGVVVVALALVNLSASFNLLHIGLPKISVPASENTQGSTSPAVTDGKQVVQMKVTARGYTPNKFTVKKGIPVEWDINVTDISTCASYIMAPDMNIQKLLKKGQNTLAFTPSEVGTLDFSCSMGMYTGSFTVVE